MEKPFEPKYDLYASVEDMLAPESLSKLLVRPVHHVNCQPMNGHDGLAGGTLSYVTTDAGRFVLKRMSITSDWIMFASQDRQCRHIALWQYGLLDQLRPCLEHKILACARDGDGWAILMEDLSGQVFTWDQPKTALLVRVFLDALASLHAAFWKDARLNDPRLGLCDTTRLLDQTSLPVAQMHSNPSMGVIPDWIRGGWQVMQELLDPDIYARMRSLCEEPQPLIQALQCYPVTLLHGDYRNTNLAFPGHPVALDWQEASQSLMTIDLAWFMFSVSDGNGRVLQEANAYYRSRLQAYLNETFDDAEWQAMLELGYLVDALRSTCFPAYWYRNDSNPANRKENLRKVKTKARMVRNGMRWL